MPKIRAFTPSWLSPDAPDGRGLFAPSLASARKSALGASVASPRASVYGGPKPQAAAPGPRRTIARRGTEVFVANGREIRWADLAAMKGAWETTHDGLGSAAAASAAKAAYRTLKPPVASDIRQLVISPHAAYMAILTAHTVHICVLPDPSHLTAAHDPDVPLKARYFTLGPTTHVTTRAPVVSALWHPLGVNGTAIATVTRDAVVRLWEISPVDRWSFDQPSLAIDAKKLADGTWLDQDFGASATASTGFSPDLFDMEVAAACFGPRSSGGWSSMTLYLAMLGGDVYALCPLLPKRFAPPPALVPSLSVAVVSNLAAVEDDADASARAKQLARQQLDWMSQIDNQEPALVDGAAAAEGEPPTEIFARPSHPSAVPRLQGPFEVDLDDDDDDDSDGNDGDSAADDGSSFSELCDIFVIGEKVDTQFLAGDEDDAEELRYSDVVDGADQEGLSLPVVCLATNKGKLHICLDLVGVEAQWLPPRGHHAHKSSLGGSSTLNGRSPPEAAQSSARRLPTFQVIDVVRASEKRPGAWCTFSPDATSRYSFFVTHPGGITNISLSSWAFRLEQELQEPTDTGADFRVRQLVTGENAVRQRVYTHSRDEPLAAATVMLDPDLGYFLLSATEYAPVAICFEPPAEDGDDGAPFGSTIGNSNSSNNNGGSSSSSNLHHGGLQPAAASAATAAARKTAAEEAEDKAVLALDFWKARPAFEMPPELLAQSELAQAKSMLFSSRYQMLQHQQVRLSAATLAIFTNTHKLVSKETGRLNLAAAQMFTKLEDLPVHLREQVESAYALKRRIDMIAGDDGDDDDGRGDRGVAGSAAHLPDDLRLRQRLQQAQDRQKALGERMERLRRTFGRASARPLSDKERAWSQEVLALETGLERAGGGGAAAGADASPRPDRVLPSKAASDIGLRVTRLHGLWDDLSKKAEAQLAHKKAAAAAAGDASSPSPLELSTASLAASAHSGTGSGSGTPSPPASITGAEARTAQAPHHLLKVPADVRKAKMAQVAKLLERETAMVGAVTERLERLGVSAL